MQGKGVRREYWPVFSCPQEYLANSPFCTAVNVTEVQNGALARPEWQRSAAGSPSGEGQLAADAGKAARGGSGRTEGRPPALTRVRDFLRVLSEPQGELNPILEDLCDRIEPQDDGDDPFGLFDGTPEAD